MATCTSTSHQIDDHQTKLANMREQPGAHGNSRVRVFAYIDAISVMHGASEEIQENSPHAEERFALDGNSNALRSAWG